MTTHTHDAECRCRNGYDCPHRCWHCKAARADGCETWCHIRPFDLPDGVEDNPLIRDHAGNARLRAELAEITTVAKLNHGLHAAAHDEAEKTRSERNQARDIAVELENQLAAVQDYLRFSGDDGIRTRETVLRILTGPAATEDQP